MTSNLRELPNGMRIADTSFAETQQFYRDIFEKRLYLKHGLHVGANDVVFDVGANVGLFTLLIHSLEPTARVFAFEPAPPLFSLLEANVRLHGSDARLFPIGLGAASATLPFTFYPNSSGMSSFYPKEEDEKRVLSTVMRKELTDRSDSLEARVLLSDMEALLAYRLQRRIYNCQTRTISQLIDDSNLSQIDLLKIDAQKSELEILEGLQEKDWDKVSQVVLEVHDTVGQLDTIHSIMVQHGFDVVVEQDELYRASSHFMVYAANGCNLQKSDKSRVKNPFEHIAQRAERQINSYSSIPTRKSDD